MAIKSITLNNYRAFGPHDTRVPNDPEVQFGAVNVFVGANGSGKTALMNAIKLAFGRVAENSQAVLDAAFLLLRRRKRLVGRAKPLPERNDRLQPRVLSREGSPSRARPAEGVGLLGHPASHALSARGRSRTGALRAPRAESEA